VAPGAMVPDDHPVRVRPIAATPGMAPEAQDGPPAASSSPVPGSPGSAGVHRGGPRLAPGVGPFGGSGGQPVPAAVATGTAKVVKNASLTVSPQAGRRLGDGYQRAVDAAGRRRRGGSQASPDRHRPGGR